MSKLLEISKKEAEMSKQRVSQLETRLDEEMQIMKLELEETLLSQGNF
jgi:hypothetical protein